MINNLNENKLYFCGILGEFQNSTDEFAKVINESKVDFPDSNDPIEWIKFYNESKAIVSRFISPPVRSLLYQLVDPRSGVNAIVIDRLPYEHPGKIPTDGRRPNGKKKFSEMLLVGLVAVVGLEVFGYNQEKQGDLVHQVAPTKLKANTQSNEGKVFFGYHTDDGCFYPFQPEFLFLLGLINEEVSTLILTIDRIIAETSTKLIEQLKQPIFTFGSPASFDFGNGRCISEQRPIIYKDEYELDSICLPGRDSIQFNEEANQILKEFHDHLDSLTKHEIVIKPGRVLGFRNDKVVHGRGKIPEKSQRWLQRIYATSNIVKYRQTVGTTQPLFVFDARVLFGK
jgi:L-asparagine oxygenase